MITTSERHTKHPFAGQNTQHLSFEIARVKKDIAVRLFFVEQKRRIVKLA